MWPKWPRLSRGPSLQRGANWVDEGALSLGICSYAIVDGHEALIYDADFGRARPHYTHGTVPGAVLEHDHAFVA